LEIGRAVTRCVSKGAGTAVHECSSDRNVTRCVSKGAGTVVHECSSDMTTITFAFDCIYSIFLIPNSGNLMAFQDRTRITQLDGFH
jgi:hypothetical protein